MERIVGVGMFQVPPIIQWIGVQLDIGATNLILNQFDLEWTERLD